VIITKIIGGLGNQMFQYAAGRSLALAKGCRLKLDISGFDKYAIHNGYELGLFNLKAEIASEEEVSRFVGVSPRIARFMRKRLGVGKKSYCLERSFAFDAGFFGNTPPVYLEGYWQSWKYFEPYANQIREEFTLSNPPVGKNAAVARQIAQTNSVSIHIRRGDYVANQATSTVHGFVGLEYYKETLRRIHAEVSAPWFFVFSDDLAWARSNLSLSDNVTFVDHNAGASSYEDMRLMSLCRHHVIANSSFSWWAAWLGYRAGKLVFYPGNWFATKEHDISSLCPPQWIQIDEVVQKCPPRVL
jgi:hypothetical protein